MSLTILKASINITKPPKKRKLLNDSYHRMLREANKRRPKNSMKHSQRMKTRKKWMQKNRQSLLKRAQFVRKWHSTHNLHSSVVRSSVVLTKDGPVYQPLVWKLQAYGSATPGNVDGQFQVGPIAFDNKNGLGNTPMGANIEYRGCVAFMPASRFLELALISSDADERAESMIALMKEGQAIAAPFLILTFEGEPKEVPVGGFRVQSHEGRGRVVAIQRITGKPNFLIPVQLFFEGWRARHLSREVFDVLDQGIVSERATRRLVQPDVDEYFWNGIRV